MLTQASCISPSALNVAMAGMLAGIFVSQEQPEDDTLPEPLISAGWKTKNGETQILRRIIEGDNLGLSRENYRARLMLMLASLEQSPMGSLPNCDATLAKLSGMDLMVETFRRRKKALLAGLILCSDNRYYSPDIAAETRDVSSENRQDELRKERDRERKRVRRSVEETGKTAVESGKFQVEFTSFPQLPRPLLLPLPFLILIQI
ncbi:hypothetical protein WCLP8_4870002 [uncultured Gammaproteobacteria bacterium]